MGFHQAESKFKQLKTQFNAGKMTEPEFKARLEELMVQDGDGTWWMIGYETEKWYRNDGKDWLRADPPVDLSQKPIRISNWVLVLSIILGFGFGWLIGGWVVLAIIMTIGDIDWYVSWSIASTIGGGLGGLVIAITFHKKGILYNRNLVTWITLGWAVGAWVGGLGTNEALIYGAIGWGISGWVMAMFLNSGHMLSNRRSMVWIPLGWAVAVAIGWIIDPPFVGEIRGTLGWGIAGGIGGLVTIWQIKKR